MIAHIIFPKSSTGRFSRSSPAWEQEENAKKKSCVMMESRN